MTFAQILLIGWKNLFRVLQNDLEVIDNPYLHPLIPVLSHAGHPELTIDENAVVVDMILHTVGAEDDLCYLDSRKCIHSVFA